MIPVFRRKKKDGTLLLADTQEAASVKREHREKPPYEPVKSPSIVRKDAEERLRQLGGDVENPKHILGQFKMQFGQFRNETFLWLAENALGYLAYLVGSIEKEATSIPTGHDNSWVHKMALKRYLRLFKEGTEAIEMKANEKKGSAPRGQATSNQGTSITSSNQGTSSAPRKQTRKETSQAAASASYVLEDDITDLQLASLAKNIERQGSAPRGQATSNQGTSNTSSNQGTSITSSNQGTSSAPRKQTRKKTIQAAASASDVPEDDITDLQLASLAKNIERQDFTICGEGFSENQPTNQTK